MKKATFTALSLFLLLAMHTVTRSDRLETADPALAAHYPLAGDATDASGNGRDGTVFGAAWTADRFGQAASACTLGGEADYISFPRYLSGAGHTLWAWVKTTDFGWQSDYLGNPALTVIGDAHQDASSAFGIQYGNARYTYRTSKLGWRYIDSWKPQINDGRWHAIAVSHHTDDTVRVYVDAISRATDKASYHPGDRGYDRIGCGYHDGGLGDYFAGSVDDVRIYDRALSGSEIQALYDAETPVHSDQDIVGWPGEYRLPQNYPNPFNAHTTIRYRLPGSGHVKILIYNTTGRLVDTLVDEVQPGGAHHVVWDAKALSSGIYFYRLIAGSFTQTGKCVLLR